MEFGRRFLFVMILSVVLSTSYCDDPDDVCCNCSSKNITRNSFPPGFLFGAGSASYQIEGAYDIDGRGPTIWDHYTHNYPGKILDLSNGDVAADSYHLYKEDVAAAKNMNLDVYRFSISWTRILPYGSLNGSRINQKGIDYYNNLINEIIEQGMEPFPSIFHWEVPQALEEAYGGFLSNKIVEDYRTYAEACFQNFGDRVKNWITFNEPWTFTNMGYAEGNFAPGRCSQWQWSGCLGGDSGIEPYRVAHHHLLAHAAAVDTYRQKYQKSQNGRIGITLVSKYFEPHNVSNYEDHEAQQRALEFVLGWFLHPITYGDYPQSMRYIVGSRLPEFTASDSALLKGSYDFLGLNYYTSLYASKASNRFSTPPSYLTDPQVDQTSERNGVPIGEVYGYWIYVYPKGIRELLKYIKKNYQNPIIIITENGVSEPNNLTAPLDVQLNDTVRLNYINDHLSCIHEAIYTDGVNVEGYIAWTLLDNFEWVSGYMERYGLYYVNFTDFTRTPKVSANWLKGILQRAPAKYNSLPSISDQ